VQHSFAFAVCSLLQAVLELARCKKVVITQAEFHFAGCAHSLPCPNPCRSKHLVHRKVTGCDPAFSAKLCSSFGSSFPCIHNTLIWIWYVIEIIHWSRANDSTIFHFFSALVSLQWFLVHVVKSYLKLSKLNSPVL